MLRARSHKAVSDKRHIGFLQIERQSAHRACAGFTIIEVLVALALVAAALAAIGSLIATNARGTRALEERIALIETARAIETGLMQRDMLSADKLDGEIDGQRWHIDVTPFATGSDDRDTGWIPQSIVIRVRSRSGARIELSTVRLLRRAKE